MLPAVGILIPTMRAHLIPTLIKNITATTPSAHTVYWACTRKSECERALRGQTVLLDEGGFWPQRINALFTLSTEPYVFLGADDVVFHPEWLELAFACMDAADRLPSGAPYISSDSPSIRAKVSSAAIRRAKVVRRKSWRRSRLRMLPS